VESPLFDKYKTTIPPMVDTRYAVFKLKSDTLRPEQTRFQVQVNPMQWGTDGSNGLENLSRIESLILDRENLWQSKTLLSEQLTLCGPSTECSREILGEPPGSHHNRADEGVRLWVTEHPWIRDDVGNLSIPERLQ